MNVIEIVYKGLIKRGRCTIDDIPEEYREGVENLLEGRTTKAEDAEIDEVEITFKKHGAITIPNTSGYILPVTKMLMDNNNANIIIPYNNIFISDLFQDEFPKDVKYFINRVENNYKAFENDNINVSIDTVDSDCVIHLKGTPTNAFDRVILRLDIRIESSNYEDMYLTIYVFGK